MKTKTKTRVPTTPIFDFELNKHTNIPQKTTGFREKNKISHSTDILCMKKKKKKDHDSRPAPDPYNTNTNSAPTLQFFFELPHLNS